MKMIITVPTFKNHNVELIQRNIKNLRTKGNNVIVSFPLHDVFGFNLPI